MAHARSYFLFPSNSLEIVLLVILYICNYAFQLPYLFVLGGGWVKAYLAGFWLGVLG